MNKQFNGGEAAIRLKHGWELKRHETRSRTPRKPRIHFVFVER
jgi:hypothetical protein